MVEVPLAADFAAPRFAQGLRARSHGLLRGIPLFPAGLSRLYGITVQLIGQAGRQCRRMPSLTSILAPPR
ncbi:MAG: hypothetical protein E5W15_17875 [Mesorhizobium sp.]|nr:MAG: hypothetical protein E5W15_17875 [Mesorhizobium sp.]TIW78678.1 MAG: hypothetical protein E5V53_21775 [Mesorhizobium sp.]